MPVWKWIGAIEWAHEFGRCDLDSNSETEWAARDSNPARRIKSPELYLMS